jgi:DNA repair ATPase RecN
MIILIVLKILLYILIYINIFYKVLKFKIKQERITKNIYNDLQLTNKKLNDIENKYYDLKQILRSHEKHINKLYNCIDYIYNSYDIINNNDNSIIYSK